MKKILLGIILLLCGCTTGAITVSKQRIDRNFLASTHVKTPDPRQDNPPKGERLLINWRLKEEVLSKSPKIILHLIFWDYEEKIETYPINKMSGLICYDLLGEEFMKTKGLLTYEAQIVLDDGSIYATWEHQLWVNLIKVDEEFKEEF